MAINYEKTLKHLVKKYNIDLNKQEPTKLPLDRYRGLTSIYRELGFKIGVEIGVNNGRYSKWLIIKAKPEKLYLVDPYKSYSEYVEQHDEEGQKQLDQCYKNAKERLERWTNQNKIEFVKKTSMDAVKDFLDNSLDFVFIDGNHTFEYVVNDIAEWSKKVKPGGIISGHDYWRSIDSKKKLYKENLSYRERIKLIQVPEAINGWTKANLIKPWFITKDLCWFYIKNDKY